MGAILSFFGWPKPAAVWTGTTATCRTILITGASGGIGAQVARTLAAQDGKVHLILVARRLEQLNQVAADCTSAGAASVRVYPCDLAATESQGIIKVFAQIANDLKTQDDERKLDIVIFNAGRSQGCMFDEILDPTQMEYMMRINVTGSVMIPLHTLWQAGAIRLDAASSRIVMIASTAGVVPVLYRTVYAASKAAVIQFANCLRLELQQMYGPNKAAAAVCTLNLPEVAGTALNAGRMDFGAKLPPVQFKPETTKSSLNQVCIDMIQAIQRGDRSWGEPSSVKVFTASLATCFPTVLESFVAKHIHRTHVRPSKNDNETGTTTEQELREKKTS